MWDEMHIVCLCGYVELVNVSLCVGFVLFSLFSLLL